MIAPLVSVPIVALLVAAATAAPTTGVLLVGRLLRLHGPVPPLAPASKLLLPADTEQKCSAQAGELQNIWKEATATGSLVPQQETGILIGLLASCWSKEKV